MHRRLIAVLGSFLMITGHVVAEVKGPEPFGKLPDGSPVEIYTLTNKNGLVAKVMNLGATLVELDVPDKAGKKVNVTTGFDDVAGYLSKDNQYFGCTTGRVANRIAKGKFTLDGKEYDVAVNNGPNHLHGGTKRSLDKVVWKAMPNSTENSITFSHTSPDGEEGYPGKLDVTVTYRLTDKNGLALEYTAKTDKATPVNLTNHSYFNLAGVGSPTVLDHELTIHADSYLPTDETQIPTGKVAPVKGTPFDFNRLTKLGARIDQVIKTEALGYDHCYIVNNKNERRTVAKLRDPESGRTMSVITDQLGLQLYTGNHLFGQKGRDGKTYAKRSAVCLETAGYPNAVNERAFPTVILRPGETYRQTCIYEFTNE